MQLNSFQFKVFFADTLKFFLSLYGHKLPVTAMDISGDSSGKNTSGDISASSGDISGTSSVGGDGRPNIIEEEPNAEICTRLVVAILINGYVSPQFVLF